MYAPHRHRAASALAAAAVIGGTAALVAAGLAAHRVPVTAPDRLVAIVTEVTPKPLPEPPPEPAPSPTPSSAPRNQAAAPKDAAAPEGARAKAAPVLAPPARIVLRPPPVPVAVETAGTGSAARPGVGERGTGSGAGGSGNGTGGGGSGGYGSGNEAGIERPRQVRGVIRFSDLPRDLRQAKAGNEITVRYRIGTEGRVSGCTVLSSSGRPDLDARTCTLITERFRFLAARDGAGRAVPYWMIETHGWDNMPGG